jgi:hypothetical protein
MSAMPQTPKLRANSPRNSELIQDLVYFRIFWSMAILAKREF